jgi:hypothetical protein
MTSQDRPNRDLVVFALGLLGGEFDSVHTEDIALKCHELFPDAFSWTRYPDIPDKDIVRVALTDARKEKYGSLVEGRSGQSLGHHSKTSRRPSSDGWALTAAGVKWFRTEGHTIGEYASSRELKDHRQQALRRLRRVLQHRVWKAFVASPTQFGPSLGDLASLLRCRVDAPEEVWRRRFEDLARDARASETQGLTDFIRHCQRAYEKAQ